MSKKYDTSKQGSLKYFYIYQKHKSLENSFISLLKKVFGIVPNQNSLNCLNYLLFICEMVLFFDTF